MTEHNSSAAADEPTDPRRPDYEDFRDPDTQQIDWRAFRAAVAAWSGDDPGGVEFIATGE